MKGELSCGKAALRQSTSRLPESAKVARPSDADGWEIVE